MLRCCRGFSASNTYRRLPDQGRPVEGISAQSKTLRGTFGGGNPGVSDVVVRIFHPTADVEMDTRLGWQYKEPRINRLAGLPLRRDLNKRLSRGVVELPGTVEWPFQFRQAGCNSM
jgi:hypothetical protein